MPSPEDYLSPNTVILGDETLTGDAASFTTVSIPSGYALIRISLYVASNSTGTGEGILLVVNGVSTGEVTRISNNQTTLSAGNVAVPTIGMVSVVGYWSTGWVEIANPATTEEIAYQASSNGVWTGTAYSNNYINAGVMTATGPLTSVTVTIAGDSFVSGSRMTVIGYK